MPTASFDTWTIVFLIAAVQGFFIAFVLLRWRRGNRQANCLLATLLFLFSFTLAEYVLYWTSYIFSFIHVANLSTQLPYLFGPLLYLYLRSIYEQKPLGKQDIWQTLPFMLAMVVYLPWLSLDTASKQAVTLGQLGFPISREIGQLLVWTRIGHLAAYAIWNIAYIRKQARAGTTARWAALLNGFFIGFLLAYSSYFILVRFSFFNADWDYLISAAMTGFIYLIAYAGYAQPDVFEGFGWVELRAVEKYKNSSLTEAASQSLLRRLSELMKTDCLYRDPELRLETLADRLDSSKHHVSQVINELMSMSFFEYINQLRIEEAQRLLAETTRNDLHVIEVAYAVGFNNKVSFNNAFKRMTGMTPTEYRKSHAKTDSPAGQPGAVGEF